MPVSLPAEVGEFSPKLYVLHPGEKLPNLPESTFDRGARVPVDIIIRDARSRQFNATVEADRRLYDMLQLSGGEYSLSFNTYERAFVALSVYIHKDDEYVTYALQEARVDETI